MIKSRIEEEVIKESLGDHFIEIIRLLKNRERVSELKLAEKAGENVNKVRSRLYILNQKGLVSFTKKKDKKTGWYIYFWSLDMKRFRKYVVDSQETQIRRLDKQIKDGCATLFFACKNACMRLDFEQATGFRFKCPECGSLMEQEEAGKKRTELKKKIMRLKEKIKA